MMLPLRVLIPAALLWGCDATATQPDIVDLAAPADLTPPADLAAPADLAPRAIQIDYTNPRRHDFTFKASAADPAATESLGTQGAYLDTRVPAKGVLVVYLHGAAAQAPTSCTQGELANVLTPMGFHVFTPCYNSYYGVGACGTDIGGCRLEAFDGIDRTAVINIQPPDAIEPRVVAAMKHLQRMHPGGDWSYFLDGDKPRWERIVIAGSSHGASSAALIGVVRSVERVVSLSGPLDTNQAWLTRAPITPPARFYGLTHTGDPQHPGHLAAFAALKLPGEVTAIDGAAPPYGGSHRLKTSAMATNAHSSTAPGSASPKLNGAYLFLPVWRYLFGG